MWCTMRLALVGFTAMCFAKESGRSHRSSDQGHADEATVQVIDPEDMEATANDVKEVQVGASMVALSEIHSAATPQSQFSDKPKYVCTKYVSQVCMEIFARDQWSCFSLAVACNRCSSTEDCVLPDACHRCWPMSVWSSESQPWSESQNRTLWWLGIAASCCLFLLGCTWLNPWGLDEPSAVQQQTAREVPLRHAEQWLQTESSPQVDPRQAFHFQVQACPLAPSAPHAPVATVEDHHEAASSKPCCVICMVAPAEFACIPCGHMCGCQLCLSKVRQCPICRQDFKQTVKVFASIV